MRFGSAPNRFRSGSPVRNGTAGRAGWRSLRPAVRRGAFAALAASVAVMGWATYVFAAPAFQSVPGVTVTPSKAYTGDSIQITLDGLPPGLSIPGGSVTLAGKRLSVPGVRGAAGIQPIADNLGKISFTTKIPLDMPYGSSELAVGNLPYGEIRTTTFKVLAAEVTFPPLRHPPMRPSP